MMRRSVSAEEGALRNVYLDTYKTIKKLKVTIYENFFILFLCY